MTSVGDFTWFLSQLGGSVLRRDKQTLRAHLIYNGRSVELAAKFSQNGVNTARISGSLSAFTWFEEKLNEHIAKDKEVDFDLLWNETEDLSQDLRAGRKVTAVRWRAHLKRLDLAHALPMTIESCEKMFQALAESHAKRIFGVSDM